MNNQQLQECAAAFDYEYGSGAWCDPKKERDRLVFGTAWFHSVTEPKLFIRGILSGADRTTSGSIGMP